jgi:hypothetical protein
MKHKTMYLLARFLSFFFSFLESDFCGCGFGNDRFTCKSVIGDASRILHFTQQTS